MSELAPHFSRIYLERGAAEDAFAQKVLARLPRASVIEIDDYREVFNRPKQDFQLQKRAKALILARKKDGLIYEGSVNCQDFDEPNLFYNTPLLNCLYNCAYCFLQGMYQSAYLVAFTNLEDFFAAARGAMVARRDTRRPLSLAVSYETDLLASEQLLPFCREWIGFAAREPEALLEIRTKSANFAAIRDLKPPENVVLAWTFSPEAVISAYEQDTPPLRARLRAAREAMDAGWPLRICFDPVLPVANWFSTYATFFQDIFSALPPARVRDASLGTFRLSASYLKRLRRNRPDTELAWRRYARDGSTLTFPREQREPLLEALHAELSRYLPDENIALWT